MGPIRDVEMAGTRLPQVLSATPFLKEMNVNTTLQRELNGRFLRELHTYDIVFWMLLKLGGCQHPHWLTTGEERLEFLQVFRHPDLFLNGR